jgi:hypothetical protein
MGAHSKEIGPLVEDFQSNTIVPIMKQLVLLDLEIESLVRQVELVEKYGELIITNEEQLEKITAVILGQAKAIRKRTKKLV